MTRKTTQQTSRPDLRLPVIMRDRQFTEAAAQAALALLPAAAKETRAHFYKPAAAVLQAAIMGAIAAYISDCKKQDGGKKADGFVFARKVAAAAAEAICNRTAGACPFLFYGFGVYSDKDNAAAAINAALFAFVFDNCKQKGGAK